MYLGLDTKQLKNRLRLVVDRRNKIAHEADMDPSYPGTRWPINPSDVASALDLVKQVCHAIDGVV
jgi:RiboL-PSP-HEPN